MIRSKVTVLGSLLSIPCAILAWTLPAPSQETNALSITGLAAGFVLPAANDGCSGKVLSAGGGSCTFTVAFQPSVNQTPGPASTTMTVTDSAGDLQTASLSGIALSPTYYLVISPNPGDWGHVAMPGRTPKTFTVTNYGVGAAPPISGVTVANAGNFSFNTGSPTCVGATLAAYGSAAAACMHSEIFTVPATSPGSLPSSPAPTLEVLFAGAAPIIAASDPLQATW